jgi:hypothetical protein
MILHQTDTPGRNTGQRPALKHRRLAQGHAEKQHSRMNASKGV